jgi:hypothetical protein
MNPSDVASPRVTATLPLTDFIPLTPHPAAENAPYVPQGMECMTLFDTFEEEHTPGITLELKHANTMPIRHNFLYHAFYAHLYLQTTKLYP